MSTVTFGPDPVAGILDALLSTLAGALAATSGGLPPRMEVGNGLAVVFDSAPMGWVRPVRVYPSQLALGQEDSQFVPRKQPFRWAVDVELGVIRCISTVQSTQNQPVLPSASQITSDSATLADDGRALRAAVQFLYPRRGDVLIRAWQPLPSAGGVGGSAIQVTVPFSDCKPTVT
jgi:hypothetical protein